ncbi:DUF1697 domain-containing protein [Niabella digestorum]|jgi:Uncharacterized protein conserved in bacteria|uniref:DUF1697 domain-containing protein n=1 Tax=Niabella digestorum TaxID=3117701 RepID=A0ABU7RJ31_9BACT
MVTYLSLLRGINVSGKRIIKMDALKQLYEKLKFKNVHTYVQSGNVIFSANKEDTKQLAQKISVQIEKEFGFDVPVIVLTSTNLKAIIDHNLLAKDKSKNAEFLHVTFLGDVPETFDKDAILKVKHPTEAIEITSSAVYLYCPNGYGKTKLNNTFLEKKLKVPATTRNWKTVNELLKLLTRGSLDKSQS